MASQQAVAADKKDADALALADNTGLSDIFSFQNSAEIIEPFFTPDVADPSDIDAAEPANKEFALNRPLAFEGPEQEKKGLFERMFGYNPADDMPWGYEKMTSFQRATMRAHLGAQNIFTRAGLGATAQLKGALQLVLPESMEQYLPSDTEKNEFRLDEDKYYEKRIQSELQTRKDEVGL